MSPKRASHQQQPPPPRAEDLAMSSQAIGTESSEITVGRAAQEALAEIQSAIIIARKFPRNRSKAYQDLMNECERTSFADKASYCFPRWSSEESRQVDITGPSVYLARVAASLYGNMRWGAIVIADDGSKRTIEGFAYDLQSNTRVSAQATFKLEGWLGKGKGWGVLNERGIRELTSRQAAFLVRNCILELVPRDFVDDALEQADATLASGVKKDPAGEKKRIIEAFSKIGVPIDGIEEYLKHSLDSISPAELKKLRQVYKSIEDGNSIWADYVAKPESSSKVEEPKVASSTNDRPVGNGHAPAQDERSVGQDPYIEDKQKGLVHSLARKNLWEKGSGRPEDALHLMLKAQFGTDSVARLRASQLQGVLDILQKSPESMGFSEEV